jgi:hypothetical protein
MITTYEDRTEYRNEQGLLHREDGPAVLCDEGTKYYINGLLHREDGPAAVYKDGTSCYYINGLSHREDGPAFEFANGLRIYYIKGRLHREDGPAIIRADGKKEYWICVGTDSRGYNFHAFYCKNYPRKVKYRVRSAFRNFTKEQALSYWENNPECLELVKKAIAKFDYIKALALIDKG